MLIDRRRFRGTLQGSRNRNSYASELPVGPVGRGEKSASPRCQNHRRFVLRGGREKSSLRIVSSESVRQKLRVVLHRLVRG